MIFINKKLIDRLTESHREPDMLVCYATLQGFSAITSRAILLINDSRIIVLFLNLFSSKVVHKVEIEVADIQNQKYHSRTPLTALWSLNIKGQHWKFRITKKIVTLGSMQSEFLNFLQQKIL
ncbi:hypothetical protein [Fontibacillus sp. BL9]|uniref:hypothetical protein n=1 Tax=Fontibacillus sp. BL9 TaxID=3389971 RepID=UPI00397B13BC